MSRMKAREALKYAFSPEILKLYSTLLIADLSLIGGAWLTANWGVRGGTAGFIGQFLGAILLLAGLIIGIGGIVAFIYKILVDANEEAGE